jgi:hypothetical protein
MAATVPGQPIEGREKSGPCRSAGVLAQRSIRLIPAVTPRRLRRLSLSRRRVIEVYASVDEVCP